MINIAIVNGDNEIAVYIKNRIEHAVFSSVIDFSIKVFKTAEKYLDSSNNNHYHVVFLAVFLPKMDGISLKNILTTKKRGAIIIYIAKDRSRMKEAFGLNVFCYILNQEIEKEIPVIIHKLVGSIFNSKMHKFKVPGGHRYEDLENVLYIILKKRRVYLVLQRGSSVILHASSLSSISKKLKSNEFIRINNQMIVNMRHIVEITKLNLTLRYCNEVFDISRGRSEEVYRVYNNYFGNFNNFLMI